MTDTQTRHLDQNQNQNQNQSQEQTCNQNQTWMRAFVKCFTLGLLAISPTLFLGWLKQRYSLIHAFDTGIYLQILANLSKGLGWASSITGEHNFLAHHFQPTIALLQPFFMLSPTPLMLFCISAVSALFSIWIIWRVFAPHLPRRFLIPVCGMLLFHPTITSRMMHSFVPEIMALPGLTLLAICLVNGRSILPISWPIYACTVIATGLTKETLWPCLAFCCFLHGYNWRKDRAISLVISFLCATAFLGLFLYWMPKHTNLPNYYGLKYYLGPDMIRPSTAREWIILLSGNLFSLRSLNTLVSDIGLLLLFLPLFGHRLCLLATVPGLAFILLSTHLAVHHPGNQYQLLTLPFMVVAILEGIKSRQFFKNQAVRRWLPILMLMPVLALHYIPMYAGTMQHMSRNEYATHITADLESAKSSILQDRRVTLIVDANLQPALFDYPNVKVLLGFVGNPMPMTAQDYINAEYIVTMVDVRSLDCAHISPDGKETLQYQYEAFHEYCSIIKNNTDLEATVYPNSGLVIYKMKKEITGIR